METVLFGISAFSLVLVGIYGVLTRRNIIKILLALNILETGINLLIVSLGTTPGGKAPILTGSTGPVTRETAKLFADPLPQALVLTSIVIGLGTTALALTLTLRYFRSKKSLELGPEMTREEAAE